MMTWKEWLTLGAEDIKSQGFDPKQRFSRIGHRRLLPLRWARTVGMWGVCETRELMTTAGLDIAVPVDRSTFEVFKHRHGVRSVKTLIAKWKTNPEEFRTDPQIFIAQAVYKGIRDLTRARWTVGAAGAELCKTLMILPVEAVLYYIRFLEVIEAGGGETRIMKTSLQVKRKLWDLVGGVRW